MITLSKNERISPHTVTPPPTHPDPYIDSWQNNTHEFDHLGFRLLTKLRLALLVFQVHIRRLCLNFILAFKYTIPLQVILLQCRDRPDFLNRSQPSCPNVQLKLRIVFFLSFPAAASINIESLSHQKH